MVQLVDGLVSEAVLLAPQILPDTTIIGWLPWLTNAELDPQQKMQDTFGKGTIHLGDKIVPQTKLYMDNHNIYPAPGSIGWSK